MDSKLPNFQRKIAKTLNIRDQIDPSARWNVENYYENETDWEAHFSSLQERKSPFWKTLTSGSISKDFQAAFDLLKAYFTLEYDHARMATYAHLRHDEDTACDKALGRMSRAQHCAHAFRQATSWIQPALIELGPFLQELAQSDQLLPYRTYLNHLLRLQAHTLSADKEALAALAEKGLETSALAFRAFNDTDVQFGKVRDSSGHEHMLTHGTYSLLMRSQDRVLRQNAYEHLHASYRSAQYTLGQLLNGTCQKHLFFAQSRGYKSCLHAALYPQDIPTSVYHNLISTVRAKSGSLQRYMNLRRKIMGVDRLQVWDLQAPLFGAQEKTWPFEQAAELVLQASAPLGQEYQTILQKALRETRWVDRFETPNKRSGAYSSGCWGHLPLILLNYHEQLQDVLTLAHEIGHSMHSYLSWQAQPYQQSEYSIFVAEVASTLSEELLFRHLLHLAQTKQERGRLIYQKLEDLRATLFRQTLFAEFEWQVHDKCEKGEALTPTALSTLYRSLCQHYFGDACAIDPLIEVEWARIPHFHYNFYVYQYATGISAALDLSQQLMSDTKGQKRLLDFLRSGSSQYPIQQLKDAGVDMTSSAPIKTALVLFESYLTELESLVL